MNLKSWTLFGQFDKTNRPSGITLAIAVIFAGETFVNSTSGYPAYMCWLALLSCGYLTYRGLKANAILSLAFPIVAALWLNPLFGGTWFDQIGVEFFLAHSALALLAAVAGFTFMRLAGTTNRKGQ